MNRHLLGKKSWNVYNEANVAKVRRDEADARAREEEEKLQREQHESENRMRLLRGESVRSSSPPAISPQIEKKDRKGESYTKPQLKRRRLANEDDTDRDIRLAETEAESQKKQQEGKEKLWKPRTDANAPLYDNAGHIVLFPEDEPISKRARRKAEKKKEIDEKKGQKLREDEDQYLMRFSNAAGYGQSLKSPWYISSAPVSEHMDTQFPDKNVWGKEDLHRRERESARLEINDPLAFMKRGVRQLKDVETERRRWNDERRKELEELKTQQREEDTERRNRKESRHLRHHRKHRHSSQINEVDSFDKYYNASHEKTKRRDDYYRERHHPTHRRHRERQHEQHRSPSPRNRKHIFKDR